MSHFDNPYDQADHDARQEEAREARRQRREDEEVERWKQTRFEAPEMQARSIIAEDDPDDYVRPTEFCEITGNKVLLIEFESNTTGRMIGDLRKDVDYALLGSLDSTDCVPVGSHFKLERSYGPPSIWGQAVVR